MLLERIGARRVGGRRPCLIDDSGDRLAALRQRLVHHGGNQRVLRFEVVVETALGKARRLHQLGQPDRVDAALAKQLLGGCHDRAPVLRPLFSGNAHIALFLRPPSA